MLSCSDPSVSMVESDPFSGMPVPIRRIVSGALQVPVVDKYVLINTLRHSTMKADSGASLDSLPIWRWILRHCFPPKVCLTKKVATTAAKLNPQTVGQPLRAWKAALVAPCTSAGNFVLTKAVMAVLTKAASQKRDRL